MNNRKKIKIKDPIKRPLENLLLQYPTENHCLDSYFYTRAAKETCGCYNCGKDILKFYKKVNGRKCYQCSECHFQVYPLAGTPLEHTHLNLRDVFHVAIQKIHHHSGITGNKIAYELNLGGGTAWRLLKRVRSWIALANGDIQLSGNVECDEVAIPTGTKGLGRKKKKRRGFGSHAITPYFTMIERNGNAKSIMIPDREEYTLLPIIIDNVKHNSTIHTDELKSYSKVESLGYKHEVVNHSKNQYKNGSACTNRVEGYFGLVKPNIKGTYRHISEQHSQDYMHEHDFRYNNRHIALSDRFQKLLDCLPPLFEHLRKKEISLQSA